MEEAEKMVALKKAYADIILNTAKEAAARVMASERKALLFQRGIASTKDEALRMLLRLKQAIDCKTTEAEKTSLNQRTRIEELEAQLDEAEERIINLRTELIEAQSNLDKVKNNHVGPLNGRTGNNDDSSHEITMLENLTSSDPIMSSPSDSGPKAVMISEVNNMLLVQKVLDDKCCDFAQQTTLSNSHLENVGHSTPDLASINVRSNEPDLYRNGCTQRIRALEKNSVDEELPLLEVDYQQYVSKSDATLRVSEQNIGICTEPSSKTENGHVMNTPGALEVPVKSSTHGERHAKVLKVRRRKSRFGKAKTRSCRSCPRQPTKSRQSSSILSHHKAFSSAKLDDTKSVKGTSMVPCAKGECMILDGKSSRLEEQLQKKQESIGFVSRSHRKRKFKHWDGIITSCRSLLDQQTEPCQRCSNTNTTTRLDHVSGCMNSDACTIEIEESWITDDATNRVTELMGDSPGIKEDGDDAGRPVTPSCRLSLEIKNEPLLDNEIKETKTSEASIGSPSAVENSRPIKYTFSRKRKKQCLTIPDEITSPGSTSTKKMALEKLSGAMPLQNPNESSRDSRRLAQVARQLISLSEKRWR